MSVRFADLDITEFGDLPLLRLRDLLAQVASGQTLKSGDGDILNKDARDAVIARRVAAGGSVHKAAPDVRRTPNHSEEKRLAAQRLASELIDRLTPLIELGLGYLSLDRGTLTLSSGELQRLRLATQLSSQLFGVVYVLDEPSAGLHPADGAALLTILQQLKAAGNSLFVVEHDLDLIRNADWIVDVGPGAGAHGGEVIYNGPLAGLADVEASHTRRYLFDMPQVRARSPRIPESWLRLEGVSRNNLRDVDVAFPVGCFTAVTGVSGSGKSSLVSQALPELVSTHLGRTLNRDDTEEADLLLEEVPEATTGRIVGDMSRISRIVQVDQKPIGRTPRSNLATYSGLFDQVRRLFAATPIARARNYNPGRFSFNVAGGRCPTCGGEGFMMVELLFLPSVYAPCSSCHGSRYNPETLKVEWRGRNIAQVLEMTVDEAFAFFADESSILRILTVLRDIGLGYLRLGQPATELSGGEAQRIKLATELQRAGRGRTLYVLDEPTSGLHPTDADRLMRHLQELVDAGNTVVVVEHDMRMVVQADWVIDLGPGAGQEGGQVIVAGLPAEVAQHDRSPTAPYLKAML